MIEIQDKCRGSLVGGAVGDALGYAVEFSSLRSILNKYGEKGIADYQLNAQGVAEFSDDTQMSLFTAEGLLNAASEGKSAVSEILPCLRQAYVNWYYTQTRSFSLLPASRISHANGLWARRAPGMTCMSALKTLSKSEKAIAANNSKGCGGVMRVAPVGIYSAAHPGWLSLEQTGCLAGYAAEITHRHPLSTYSSMALAMIVRECVTGENIDREKFRSIVTDHVFGTLGQKFPNDADLLELRTLIEKSLDLAVSDRPDTEAIFMLGEGWVAEETLAIAVFSVMRYIGDFAKCIYCAVNHDGDSDSTGAVAGNIVGAVLGYAAIPEKFKSNLELGDLLLSVADDLGAL